MKLYTQISLSYVAVFYIFHFVSGTELARHYKKKLAGLINGSLSPKRPFYTKVLANELFLCSATVIDPLFVVTAAHCVVNGNFLSFEHSSACLLKKCFRRTRYSADWRLHSDWPCSEEHQGSATRTPEVGTNKLKVLHPVPVACKRLIIL